MRVDGPRPGEEGEARYAFGLRPLRRGSQPKSVKSVLSRSMTGSSWPLPMAVTEPLFQQFERRGKESGALLSLAINPDACKGCGICAQVCTTGALLREPQLPERVVAARRLRDLWEQIPDTRSETIEQAAAHGDLKPLSAWAMSRYCNQAIAGGDGAEPGSGGKVAIRLALGAIEYHQQPLQLRQLGSLRQLRDRIGQQIRDTLVDALPTDDLDRLADRLRAAQGEPLDLATLSEASAPGDGVESGQLASLVDVAQRLNRACWLLESGRNGLGRSRYGVVVSVSRATHWTGTFPHNPFQAPVVLDRSGDAPQLAAGLLQGQLGEALALIALQQRAEALLDEQAPAAAPDWATLDPAQRQLRHCC